MKKYYYIARSPTGKKVKGNLQVENENELIDIMVQHNYKLIKCKEHKQKKQLFSIFIVNKNDLLSFCENVNMMLKAGLSLKEAIHLCQDVVKKEKFKEVLIDVEKNLSKGKSFYNCISNYPDVFPMFFRTMINLAEISGNLKVIFEYLITYYRFDISIRKKLINSMFYPCLLLVLCFIVVIVMATVIVPSFVNIFNEMKVELPLITKIIIECSNFISKYFIVFIFGFLIMFVLLYTYSKTLKGKMFFDKLKTKIFLFGKITQIILTSRFCKSLKILIDSGIPIVSCIDVCSNLLDNSYLKEKFIFAVNEIKRGSNISSALYTIEFFPSLLIETIYISEKTANLSYSLGVLGQIYEDDFHNQIQRLTTVLEPMLILFISLIVIILLVAIFIPLFSMLNNIGAY